MPPVIPFRTSIYIPRVASPRIENDHYYKLAIFQHEVYMRRVSPNILYPRIERAVNMTTQFKEPTVRDRNVFDMFTQFAHV